MTILSVLIILLGFIGSLVWLFRLQVKHISFNKRVLFGLLGGVVFGLLIRLLFQKTTHFSTSISWISLVADAYVALLQMLVMPLVFISIVGAFTKLEVSKNLGKLARNVIAILLGTAAISAVVGYLAVVAFRLNGAVFTEGVAEKTRIAALAEKQVQVKGVPITEQLLNLIPRNVFADLAGTRPTSTIAVVIFAVFLGIAFLGIQKKYRSEAKTFAELIQSFEKIILRVTTLVLRLTPFGIFALMARVMATSDFAALVNLGRFIIASYAAILLMFALHLVLLIWVKVSPREYLSKSWSTLLFAFTSRTSAGTLPMNVETQVEKFKVNEAVANFSASFGLSIGQNGCAGIYPAMLATIVAPTVGINIFSIQFIVSLIAIVTISSLGVAGVGGGATFASLIVLSSMNLPIAIVGLVISVEPVIDMARTALNVSDAMVAGIVTDRLLKKPIQSKPVKNVEFAK
ncbi:L-cystine transporter [Pseudolactococcus plantarum]|uniref:L-cystine uptake protein TcyP n=1 Tax=Pseudolactococcus plantarum TaxID=1365 RepID=A0A2A5S0R0_9LACT|nr:L-cystine transporter tcyP [Lactococcus plantarum]HCN74015.1 L-cystine transporter [Lactococcus sp.]